MAKMIKAYAPFKGEESWRNELMYPGWFTIDTSKYERGKDFIVEIYEGKRFLTDANHPNKIYQIGREEDENKIIFLKKVPQDTAKKITEKREEVIELKTEISMHEFNEASKNLDLEERV